MTLWLNRWSLKQVWLYAVTWIYVWYRDNDDDRTIMLPELWHHPVNYTCMRYWSIYGWGCQLGVKCMMRSRGRPWLSPLSPWSSTTNVITHSIWWNSFCMQQSNPGAKKKVNFSNVWRHVFNSGLLRNLIIYW